MVNHSCVSLLRPLPHSAHSVRLQGLPRTVLRTRRLSGSRGIKHTDHRKTNPPTPTKQAATIKKSRQRSSAPPPVCCYRWRAVTAGRRLSSGEEELLAQAPRLLRAGHLVADGPGVAVDLVIVSSLTWRQRRTERWAVLQLTTQRSGTLNEVGGKVWPQTCCRLTVAHLCVLQTQRQTAASVARWPRNTPDVWNRSSSTLSRKNTKQRDIQTLPAGLRTEHSSVCTRGVKHKARGPMKTRTFTQRRNKDEQGRKLLWVTSQEDHSPSNLTVPSGAFQRPRPLRCAECGPRCKWRPAL